MMVHLEGPIVDSFYDMALCSWAKPLEPTLPCLNDPASVRLPESYQSTVATRIPLHDDTIRPGLPEHMASDPHYDPDLASEIMRSQSVLLPRTGERRIDAITRHLSKHLIS